MRHAARPAVLAALAGLLARPAVAQGGTPPPVAGASPPAAAEHRGLTGFVVGGATRLSMAERDVGDRGTGGFRLGWRFALPKGIAPWLRFGPEVNFAITDVAGLDTASGDPYAFAQLGGGGQVSARVHRRLRVYGVARVGKHAAELIDADRRLWNYAGSGSAFGGGIEVPITPMGRGLDVGVARLDGSFTRADRLRVFREIDVRYRAWVVHLGWGGPVTIGLPWQ